MESMRDDNTDRAAAARDLRSVEDARSEMVQDIECPPGFELAGTASAGLNVAGVGMVLDDSVALQIVGIVLVLAGAYGVGWSVRRFRNFNGVWVSGYRKGRTLSTTLAFVSVQILALAVATAASIANGWWWMGIAEAPLLMLAFAAGNRRWLSVYRAENGLAG